MLNLLLIILGCLFFMMKPPSSKNIEDQYLSPDQDQIERLNFVVLSGCSGGGKSTLLSELARRGYSTIPEPGRQIVKEQVAIGGDGLPYKNLDKFLELALSRYIYQFNSVAEKEQIVFFDRSIVDSIQLDGRQGSHFSNAAKKFRYHRAVFLVPPWKEIYRRDSERAHPFEEALLEYHELLVKYRQFGYEVFIVPQGQVEERADFIIAKLHAPLTLQIPR
jgi:predicted ATPase